MTSLSALHLRHFGAFHGLDMEFVPGLNLFVGQNGTGKTQLLKLLYAACRATHPEEGFGSKLIAVFKPSDGKIGRLVRRGDGEAADLRVERAGEWLSAGFSSRMEKPGSIDLRFSEGWHSWPLDATYIPPREILAQAPGFRSLYARRETSFEESYADLLDLAYLPRLKSPLPRALGAISRQLMTAIGGRVLIKGEQFFLKGSKGELEFSLLAEGLRKLALLLLLLQNGSLREGTVLFWDEPEANLNPSLIRLVVEVLVALEGAKVQIFAATHSYVFLKYLDLRQQETNQVRYFSLFREPSGEINATCSEDYLGITPNDIAATFSDLYDLELRRSLAGLGA
jgi:energy-coupling factor transporter ATP-binding protein EcfA2